MADDFEDLVAGLRRWTATHDAHVRAAVELLIWHEYWIRRRDFGQAALKYGAGGIVTIDWRAARSFHDAGTTASTSQMAVLDLAIDLAGNRYKLTGMGHAHARAMATAFCSALGLGAPGEASHG